MNGFLTSMKKRNSDLSAKDWIHNRLARKDVIYGMDVFTFFKKSSGCLRLPKRVPLVPGCFMLSW